MAATEPLESQDVSHIKALGTEPAVVILEDDLFFSTRLADVVTAQGGFPVVVESPQAFVEAMDRFFPVLALLDLKVPGDWESAVVRCKIRPHTGQIPIFAFGSHVDVETLRRARRAGVDHAWARSRMMEQVVAVVDRHIRPPVRQLAGCEEPLSELAVAGLREFNRGDYYEQHEYLEKAWMQESRPIRSMYQGILQVGVAFYQIQQNNWAGAVKMFRRGLPRLRDLPDVCQGVQLGRFRAAAEGIHGEICRLGPEDLAHFDRAQFPKVEFVDPRPDRMP
jgi:CheY-like chemotaxis protein